MIDVGGTAAAPMWKRVSAAEAHVAASDSPSGGLSWGSQILQRPQRLWICCMCLDCSEESDDCRPIAGQLYWTNVRLCALKRGAETAAEFGRDVLRPVTERLSRLFWAGEWSPTDFGFFAQRWQSWTWTVRTCQIAGIHGQTWGRDTFAASVKRGKGVETVKRKGHWKRDLQNLQRKAFFFPDLNLLLTSPYLQRLWLWTCGKAFEVQSRTGKHFSTHTHIQTSTHKRSQTWFLSWKRVYKQVS